MFLGSKEMIKIFKTYTRQFFINKNDLSSIGKNPYFILQPGYQLVFKGREAGKKLMATITVLNKTKIINGVTARIVEERDYEDRKLIEIARNYFAISKTNNSVFYFGEDVDIFDKNGKIVSHKGSWRAGSKGAKPVQRWIGMFDFLNLLTKGPPVVATPTSTPIVRKERARLRT
jgi:hypothetical protein